jgi:hypothetical protein
MWPFIFAAVILFSGFGLAALMAYADYMRTIPTGTDSPVWVAGASLILCVIVASSYWW